MQVERRKNYKSILSALTTLDSGYDEHFEDYVIREGVKVGDELGYEFVADMLDRQFQYSPDLGGILKSRTAFAEIFNDRIGRGVYKNAENAIRGMLSSVGATETKLYRGVELFYQGLRIGADQAFSRRVAELIAELPVIWPEE